MTDRELFMKVLDALEWNLPVIQDYGDKEQLNIQHNAIIAIREKMGFYGYKPTLLKTANESKPEQEPVAHTTGHCENHKQKSGCQLHNLQCGWPDCDRKPITHSPQRKPLTFEEILSIAEESRKHVYPSIAFARAIEAAHGIKGEP